MTNANDFLHIFRSSPPKTRLHIAIRWRLFSFPALAPYVPEQGVLVDLGCGHGLWPFYLTRLRPHTEIWGIDPDAEKIAFAQGLAQAQEYHCLHFVTGSAQGVDFPSCSMISLIDMLYLIPFDEQARILTHAAARLTPGGRILIKEMSLRPRWKFAWNWLQEWLAVRLLGITFGGRFYFHNEHEWEELLQSLGLRVTIVRLDRGYLHPHVLIVGEKMPHG